MMLDNGFKKVSLLGSCSAHVFLWIMMLQNTKVDPMHFLESLWMVHGWEPSRCEDLGAVEVAKKSGFVTWRTNQSSFVLSYLGKGELYFKKWVGFLPNKGVSPTIKTHTCLFYVSEVKLTICKKENRIMHDYLKDNLSRNRHKGQPAGEEG